MADASSFTKLVPGFDFLQGLVRNAGSALPSMGQWIAPTLDPVELDKRIQELKTVQFWLEQNARMISATIQALEVQRMTLATLQSMNVSVGHLQDALKVHVPDSSDDAPAKSSRPAKSAWAATPAPAAEAKAEPEAAAPAGAVDPMQWWNSLTQQFTQLATDAMNAAGEAAQSAAQTAATAAATASTAASTAAAAAAADAPAEVAPAAAPTDVPPAKSAKGPVRKAAPRSRRAAT